MKNVSRVVDDAITLIETKMTVYGKHIIKTDVIQYIALSHVKISALNDDTEYLANVGFGQIIQSRLYERGYRSVRKGRFVNLDRCDDIDYLKELLHSSDQNVKDKEKVRARIKELRDHVLSGQISFDIDGNVIKGMSIPLTEDELNEKLEADAVGEELA